MFHVPIQDRVRIGEFASTDSAGNNGHFVIRHFAVKLHVIASDGLGWEHVSVSINSRIPRWNEMNFIKDTFWDEEDCVIQYHPPKSLYVNNCKFCLHLWRPVFAEIILPPTILIGV